MKSCSRHVRVAVVGYGYWGSKHVRVLSSLPDVSVSVVDADPARLSDAAIHYPSASLAHQFAEVLDDVDAVVIATPATQHASVAHAALEAGRHVMAEKPLTTTVEDGELLVDAAHRNDVLLMVGHTFEYNPAVWKLKEIIASGMLGRILYIDTQRLGLGRYQSDVNVIWDLAPHDISIISFLLGELPASTTVWAQHNIDPRQADVAYVRLDFPVARTHAVIHVSWLSPNKVRKVTVVGERRMAVYDDMSDNERVRIYDIGVDPALIDDPAMSHAMPVSYRTGDITSPYIPFSEPLLVQDSHFVDCLRNGEQCRTPGERGLDVVRVLAATTHSGVTGQQAGAQGRVPVPTSRGEHSMATL